MRFAVLANVQGNAVALRATLDAIESRQRRVERVVCAGDLVGLGAQPNDVLELLRERGVEAVRGNYDDAVALGRDESGTDFADARSEEADAAALMWTRETLSPTNLEYLRALPRDLRLSPGSGGVRVGRNEADEREREYKRTFFLRAMLGGLFRTPVTGSKRVLVMHGTPRALNEFVRQDTANSILSAVARDTQADILITAHSGTAFCRESGGITFIGPGSVAGPYARPGVAQYAVVTTSETVDVEFIEVDYDPRPYQEELEKSSLAGASRAAGDTP